MTSAPPPALVAPSSRFSWLGALLLDLPVLVVIAVLAGLHVLGRAELVQLLLPYLVARAALRKPGGPGPGAGSSGGGTTGSSSSPALAASPAAGSSHMGRLRGLAEGSALAAVALGVFLLALRIVAVLAGRTREA